MEAVRKAMMTAHIRLQNEKEDIAAWQAHWLETMEHE